jgi:hypothetical protein
MYNFIGLMVFLFAGAAFAQAPKDKITVALENTAWIIQEIAALDVASETCRFAKRPEWDNVIAAIDKRFRYCVAQDSSWKLLGIGFAPLEEKSVAEGSSRSLGSFIADSKKAGEVGQLEWSGKRHYCSARPWRLQAAPEKVTAEDKAEFLKSHPGYPLDGVISTGAFILSLGANTAWVEAPCDAFWPMISRR